MLHRQGRLIFRHRSLKSAEYFPIRKNQQHAIAERPQPKYPPIIDTSPEGFARHERQLWYDSVKALPTVEQKLYEITKNRPYSALLYLVSSCSNTYLGVPFQRYVTRTHLLQGLPESYMAMNVDEEFDLLKSELPTVAARYFSNFWKQSKLKSLEEFTNEKGCGSDLVNALLSSICRACGEKNPQLLEYAFDQKPYLRSYWLHGGFASKQNLLNEQNLCFQFTDEAAYTIRASNPLPPVLPPDDPMCTTPEVVDYNYHPRVFGIARSRRYLTCIPGFWPSDPCDFPLLQIHTSDRIKKMTSKLDHYDLKTIEDGYGVMASFGWLNGLAAYQGFTAYHDLTYPIVGHTILTNGQDWTFFVYQLNTMCFHSDLDKKDRRNLCWTSPKLTLFETIENGELKGVNEDVFKLLLKFVLKKPENREDINLKPYLGKETRSEEEIEEMRKEARKLYRNIIDYHNYHKREVPLWQRIYKKHKDAPPSPWIKLE